MTPPDAAPSATALGDAVHAMHEVREKCVWSAAITHRDLVPYLVEESAELIDAVEQGDVAELREELGDVLWQVLFHSEIASRRTEDAFDISDVARDLTEKMVRRHPHVFGDERADTPEEVLVLWNAAKAREKKHRTSVLDGVSAHMPSLAWTQKIVGKAAGVRGLEEAAIDGADALSQAPTTEAELGEALLALTALAREQGWDAERALRERTRRLEADIRTAEGAPAA